MVNYILLFLIVTLLLFIILLLANKRIQNNYYFIEEKMILPKLRNSKHKQNENIEKINRQKIRKIFNKDNNYYSDSKTEST